MARGASGGADAADPDVLDQLGISGFDGAVVDTSHDLERKVLITLRGLTRTGFCGMIYKEIFAAGSAAITRKSDFSNGKERAAL